jgi:hypothetical protein
MSCDARKWVNGLIPTPASQRTQLVVKRWWYEKLMLFILGNAMSEHRSLMEQIIPNSIKIEHYCKKIISERHDQ